MKSRMEKGDNFGKRMTVYVGVLVATQFAELYGTAIHVNGFAPSPALPNITFILGLVLYIVTQFDTTNVASYEGKRVPERAGPLWLVCSKRKGL